MQSAAGETGAGASWKQGSASCVVPENPPAFERQR